MDANPKRKPQLVQPNVGSPGRMRGASDTYPHYKPGNYEARCIEAQPYTDPQFKRQKCLLRFQIVSLDEAVSNGPVCAILNLKNEEDPGKRSRYRHEWIIANGGPPRKGQTWSHEVFEDKIFLVRLGDTTIRWDGEKHHATEVYSTVQAILERRWP